MKEITKVALAVVALGVVLILLVGCESAKISDITRDPGHFSGKEVTIVGRVTNSFGALNEGAFEVEDGTGHMWVIAEGFGVPSQGSRVAVTGRVQSGFSFFGKSFGTVLRQTRRRHGG
ncbi:MAG TPA: OB-fold nucleic acid binding domain-containing protein [Candidatus Dormibacteraeota bacterium]|nr:OB-fold nucleic acid binding domain-containing protein [Candidatus Dormibacteraeota bacterium]